MALSYWIIGAIVGIIGWQYAAIVGQEEELFTIWRPSEVIDKIADFFGVIFGYLGAGFARLSSFLVHLKLERIATAIWQLLLSCWHVATSVWEFAVEYTGVASLYDHPYLVTIGSIIVVSLIVYGAGRYFGWTRLAQHQKIILPILAFLAVGVFAGFFYDRFPKLMDYSMIPFLFLGVFIWMIVNLVDLNNQATVHRTQQ